MSDNATILQRKSWKDLQKVKRVLKTTLKNLLGKKYENLGHGSRLFS